MAIFTPRFNLRKPDRTEYFSIVRDFNDNWDKLDLLVAKEVDLQAVESRVDVIESDVVIIESDIDSLELRATTAESDIDNLELSKVDKITGKDLSENDYTDADKLLLTETIPAQLAEIEQEQGLLSGLLTTAKTSLVNAINELFNNKANKAQENWITPTLLNGWLNDSVNGFVGIKYMKDSMGFVHIEGGVNNTISTGAIIFNLPMGYRKSAALVAAATPTSIRINSNGDVFPTSNTTQVRLYLVFKPD